jgi:DNA-binding MarR family transcriptional regulator
LERIPVLTENNWKSKQTLDEFDKEIRKRMEAGPQIGKATITVFEDFQQYGVFVLIYFLKDVQLKIVSVLLCLQPEYGFTQFNFQKMLSISRSHISGVLKVLQVYRLVNAYPGNVKGRARGRQLVYSLSDKARDRLEQDLKDHDFFREAIVQTVQPFAEAYNMFHWRRDFLRQDPL